TEGRNPEAFIARGTQEGRARSPLSKCMAEPHADPDRPDKREDAAPPAPLPLSPLLNEAFQAKDLFGSGVEPTDNTPPIISRSPPTPLKTEEALMGTLRGRRLAHFELLDADGIGGMAAVIRSRDTQLDRTVALKILPPEMADDSEIVRRFHQEARAAAKLDH